MDDELLGLIDRLEAVLADSGLEELEVEAEGMALRVRRPRAVAPAPANPGPVAPAKPIGTAVGAAPGGAAASPARQPALHRVLAPLTGLFYTAPTPDAPPYVSEGAEVHEGQVIGLIEAMKLFNEIKSDAHGRVARVVAGNGQLVRAGQPLIEVEPA